MILQGLLVLSCAVAVADGFSILPPRMLHMTRQCGRLSMATAATQETDRGSPVVNDPRSIRNVAFVGHSHSGKTALVEWMLYDENVITKKPASGESCLDSDPVEAARHSSVFSHFARVPHRSFLLEVADTPWGDFPTDALAALDGADSAVIVVSAADGVQTGTINAYQHCRSAGIKTMVALSKMDRPFLQVEEVLDDIETTLGMRPVPLQVNLGEGDDFGGVEPLLLVDNGVVKKNEADGLENAWTTLEEAVAMTDDDLLVEYMENSELEPDQVIRGLRSGIRQEKILPLVYTSAENDLGVSELMDAMAAVLPDPVEMREEALRAACESDKGMCGQVPGVEAGFAARVLHTTVDSFGSVSVLRVISNSRDDDADGAFHSLPHEAVNLRTGDKIKMPSASNSFGLCGKERLPLDDKAHLNPGDVIAVPKLPETVRTNDILTIPSAVKEEEAEIFVEAATNVLSPLSRPVEKVPLMASATVSLPEVSGKKAKGKSSGGEDKLTRALAAMAREDLALKIEQDAASGMLLVRCMSGEHLQLVASRLKDRYDIDIELGRPPVQYRETLVKAVRKIEGRHKKQSGGSGQFGVCYINMEPLEEGSGIEFETQIKGGAISRPFITSVEKGVREQLESGGPLAGYPVTDVRVTLIDGKMHSVDSKDIAFRSAGRLAVKAALERGKTRLIQPMEKVTFVVDDKLQGEVSAIVSRQEGYVTSTNPSDSGADLEVEAILPTAAIADVSDVLRAASAGEGQFTSVFSHYQPVPDNQIEDIVGNSPNQHKLMP